MITCLFWPLGPALLSLPLSLSLFLFAPRQECHSLVRDSVLLALRHPWKGTRITIQFLCQMLFVRGLLGSDPADLTLESATPSPRQRSIWHQLNIDSTSIS